MKVNKFRQQLRQMSEAELQSEVDSLQRELFAARLNAATHIKDYSVFKKLRGDIARALTFLHNKQQKGS